MAGIKQPNLTPEQKKKIEQKLIGIFKDVYFNNPNILTAKSESDHISEEIRTFILGYAESNFNMNEVDLLLKAKEKGQELVGNHDLIFFDEKIDKSLHMRAFLIPGMKVEFTEENATEKVTEDDLQIVDHELCVSFKIAEINEFTKIGNLVDIRATLVRALSSKSEDNKEVNGLIKDNKIFKDSLQHVFNSASRVIAREES